MGYLKGEHDQKAFQSSEVLEEGLRSFSWDAVPGVAGSLTLYAVSARRTEVYMAQLGDVSALEEAFLGAAPRMVGEAELNRAYCVTDVPFAGTLVDVTRLTYGSKQVQVFSPGYRRLRGLRPEIDCADAPGGPQPSGG